MSKKNLHIVGLSLVAFTVNARDREGEANTRLVATTADQRSVTPGGQASSLIVSPKETQLLLFSGLFMVFILMVALLFRKYRNRKRPAIRAIKRESFVQNILKADGLSFTPSVFQSDASPAILVAQHNEDLRLFITNTLRLNYRVISVETGEEAYQKAFDMVPDVIITDRFLPGMEGPIFCKRIKQSEVTSHIPLIMITPKAQHHIAFDDWQDNADDHLPSAFDARELLLRVHALITHRKNLQEVYRRHIRLRDEDIQLPLPEQPFLFKLKRVLRTYYGDPLFGVEQMTDQLQMSRMQLYRKLKALTTYSPSEFIRFYRIEQAKAMIEEGLSMNDIARKAGFNNAGSFMKSFKDLTGKNPAEYVARTAQERSMVPD
jgi:CheY-like chemotaxis protein